MPPLANFPMIVDSVDDARILDSFGGVVSSGHRNETLKEVPLSTRRIPKGPGRRPKSLARRRFMELLAQGWSLSAACREVGVVRTTGHNWKNGAKVRLKDGTVKLVPPVDPLSVRALSSRFLSEHERIQIADLASQGLGPTAIGVRLSRAPSTISRELRRNRHDTGQYRPFHAHAAAAVRRRRPKATKIAQSSRLERFVRDKLQVRWSPQQISRALRAAHPDDASMRVAHETIYLEIYRPGNTIARRPVADSLRTGRDHRRGHSRQIRAGRRFAQPMLSIHDRGFDPQDRSEAGHWESQCCCQAAIGNARPGST